MARIVTYAMLTAPSGHPAGTLRLSPLTVPRIVKGPTKGERTPRRDAEPAREVDAEEDAAVMELLRRMMRPREK
jgi:hypothetical protein